LIAKRLSKSLEVATLVATCVVSYSRLFNTLLHHSRSTNIWH